MFRSSYSNLIFLTVCAEITKCEHTECSNGTYAKCVQCEGTVVNQVYGRALTPAADDGQSCQGEMNVLFDWFVLGRGINVIVMDIYI